MKKRSSSACLYCKVSDGGVSVCMLLVCTLMLICWMLSVLNTMVSVPLSLLIVTLPRQEVRIPAVSAVPAMRMRMAFFIDG